MRYKKVNKFEPKPQVFNPVKKETSIAPRDRGVRLVELKKPEVMDISSKMREIMQRGGMLDG